MSSETVQLHVALLVFEHYILAAQVLVYSHREELLHRQTWLHVNKLHSQAVSMFVDQMVAKGEKIGPLHHSVRDE